MNMISIVTRLYETSGFEVPAMGAARMLGCDASRLHDFLRAIEKQKTVRGVSQDEIAFERKMRRAQRVIRLLGALPFVRAIAICNSLALHTSRVDSDIDLFVITARGRVWSARWWVTGMLALLRLRTGEAYRDPVCASFFVDESVQSLESIAIDRDVYLYYWERSLMPVVGSHALFARAAELPPAFRIRSVRKNWIVLCFEWCARLVSEQFVCDQQLKILPEEVNEALERDDLGVVCSDLIIKLHTQDSRAAVRDMVVTRH